MMEILDEELAEANKNEEEEFEYIRNPSKGKSYAERKVRASGKPCWTKCMGYLGSITVGSVGPFVGYLIIQLMWGVTEA